MERNSQGDQPQGTGDKPASRRGFPGMWIVAVVLVALAVALYLNRDEPRDTIEYDFLLDQLKTQNVLQLHIGDLEATGMFKDPPLARPKLDRASGKEVSAVDKATGRPLVHRRHFRVDLGRDSESRAELQAVAKEGGARLTLAQGDNSLLLFYSVLLLIPLAVVLYMWISFRRTRDQIMGGGFLSGFSKSPAKRYEASKKPITFNDVAGLEGVKSDLLEIVDFLKNPEKFQRLGGQVPKGVLLNGPPGTGKTLLARAVAGEAGVPFYSVNGSEFIQMFVGVGASRVRDLFATAKEHSPSIIFIDEIDAVGRQRGAGLGGGHDEREQTLNQILSEMDGFTPNDATIVMAATNRPDVLDPALLRPGRFDRHVTVGRPTHKGRIEIFKVHVRDVPLADDVDIERLSSGTVGLTGADIRNIVNEAALWAARNDKNRVAMSDFEHARDKVLMGAKREEVLKDEEKEKTAYHEAGHTLMAWHLPGSHPVHKVTIIPRGRSLGATHTMPTEDRLSMSESELRDHLVVLLAGRAAEKMIYDQTTVGAENDLERATGLARRMVTHWGMSQRLGPVSYKLSDDDPFLGREIHQQRQFSEHTMELIDDEVAKILHDASDRAATALREQRADLECLAQALLVREELDEADIARLIGPSVHAQAKSNSVPAGKAVAKSSVDERPI